jgi:hypothetical protein
MTLAHDAVIKITKDDMKTFEEAKKVAEYAIFNRNPSLGFQYVREKKRSMQMNAWESALILWEMEREWKEGGAFESADDFLQVAHEETGYARDSIRRLLKTWEEMIAAPKYQLEDGEVVIKEHGAKRRKRILGHAAGTAYLLSSAAREGEMTEAYWEEFELAPDQATVREIRQNIRGDQTSSSSALKLMMEPDGTLKVRRKGPYKVWGMVNVHLRDDPDIDAAINRLEKIGVFER